MKATKLLHNLGQSIWLDNITRDLLNTGTLQKYIDELSVTGLTSNPTIFDHAIKNSTAYDSAIREKLAQGKSGEALFFELALEDLTRAADIFRPIHDRSNGVDGWVSLEVSPLLAYDTRSTLAAAKELCGRADRRNLFIKIPGTKEGLPAIEEAIFAGVPVNVTLLFSREHYLAAAESFLRGIERRIEAGLNPNVGSVASVFVSRWDSAVAGKVPADLTNRLGIAIAERTYKACRSLLSSPRWQRIYNAGAHPQRLLWASTGTKAGSHLESSCGTHPTGINPLGRRWRLRRSADPVWQVRCRCGRPRGPASRRRRQIIREILERLDERDYVQERRPQEGCRKLNLLSQSC
jgi:transaldolase